MGLQVPSPPPPTARFSYGGGWDNSLTKKSGTDVVRFNAVIAWSSTEGMEKWYSYFANDAMQSYERLGHIRLSIDFNSL